MVSKKGDINKTIEKIKSNYKRTLLHNKLKHVNKLYKKMDNYEKYITSCLHKTVFRLEPEKLVLIKNRFTLDFFTLKDIETFFKV